MKVHFIAIGGSIMHNLAIALKNQGDEVTGSDDEIFEPAKGKLREKGLLPENTGWDPGRLNSGLDAVILGMHAKPDNPELKRALDLGLPVYSFPEFIANRTQQQKRVVIAGSHGKTTITSMIMHVLSQQGMAFDYVVGAPVPGFELSLKLSNAPVIIIEGDEYLSSPVDKRPKFLWYQPHIALLSGIAWDHINVFPTYAVYLQAFYDFLAQRKKEDVVIYNALDEEVRELLGREEWPFSSFPYQLPSYRVSGNVAILQRPEGDIPVRIFGQHNLTNMEGAKLVCSQLNVEEADFYQAMKSFEGAGKRLDKIAEGPDGVIFRDFAHSPSKVKATVEAVREQYPDRQLVACLELHTFSSLNKNFLPLYKDSLAPADVPCVLLHPHVVELKRLEKISEEEIKSFFNRPDLHFFSDAENMLQFLLSLKWSPSVLLLMSSGNFDGMDLEELKKIVAA
ncbi:MAG: Mur ligase family protein [Bacteroidia bacterium]